MTLFPLIMSNYAILPQVATSYVAVLRTKDLLDDRFRGRMVYNITSTVVDVKIIGEISTAEIRT